MDRFTLKSRKGTAHEYHVTPHPASDGVKLAMKLASLSLPGLLSLLGGLLESEEFRTMAAAAVSPGAGGAAPSASTLAGGVMEILESLEGVDLSQLASELRTALADPGAAGIVRELLQHTTRTNEHGQPQPLKNQAVWEMAYTANYFELFKAAFQAAVVNGFFPELSTSATSSTSPPGRPVPGSPRTIVTGGSTGATT